MSGFDAFGGGAFGEGFAFAGFGVAGAAVFEEMGEAFAEEGGGEGLMDFAVGAEGDLAGFFGDDDGDGVGLFGDAHGGAVAEADGAV